MLAEDSAWIPKLAHLKHQRYGNIAVPENIHITFKALKARNSKAQGGRAREASSETLGSG
jgi:hypothetical protein